MPENRALISSASFLSLPPEIWRLVGQEVQGPQTLEALTRVCRAFRDIFTPLLNMRRVIQLNRCKVADLDQKALPVGIRFTKDLEILLLEFVRNQPPYKTKSNETYALFITRMLKAMPHIQSFRWLDATYENGYNPCLMLKHPELLDTLKKCQTLQKLSIQFTSKCLDWDDESEDEEEQGAFVSLKGFSNLTSLELYEFYGDPTDLGKELASVLKDLPMLKTLGLGMQYPSEVCFVFEVLVSSEESLFLESLCLEYHSLKGSTPLALETLRLGRGMFFYRSDPTSMDNPLAKLVKVEGLKTFHVWNGFYRFFSDDSIDPTQWRIDFTLLNGCESLRQLSVTRLSSNIRRWLDGPGQSVEELKVTDHYNMYDPTLNNFNRLKLPNLSLLFTRETTVKLPEDWENEFTDVDSSATEIEDSDLDSETPRARPCKSTITVLDRLRDGGSKLTRLGICIDFEAHWERFSRHLPFLKNLTQLSLHGRSQKPGQFPTKASSLWPGIEKPKQIAMRYAKLAKSICPSLQYVQIRRWAWQVTADHELPSGGNDDVCDYIHLRQLEFEEVLAIELFAMDTFVNQAGLTGPQHPYEEKSEEEEERMGRMFERMEQGFAEGRDLATLSWGLSVSQDWAHCVKTTFST